MLGGTSLYYGYNFLNFIKGECSTAQYNFTIAGYHDFDMMSIHGQIPDVEHIVADFTSKAEIFLGARLYREIFRNRIAKVASRAVRGAERHGSQWKKRECGQAADGELRTNLKFHARY